MVIRKRLLSIALALFMLLLLLPVTSPPAQALELGTPDDPIRISTATQLNLMRYNLDKHYILVADIDLSGYPNWEPIGSPGNGFSGTLDGNWHTVSNLSIDKTGNYCIGLFGYICKPAVIKNLKLTNVKVTASSNAQVGGLVGVVRNDLGTGDNITIENCYVDGVVSNSGTGETGGLVGYLYSYTSPGPVVSKCWSNVKVTGQIRVGGLIGAVYNGSVENSFATDAVSGQSNTGGLVGALSGNIRNSYATGLVTCPDPNSGGLLGISSGAVTSSYYDSLTTGQSDIGKGVPQTTDEMKNPANFLDWDTDIWNLTEGQYPALRNYAGTLHTVTYNLNGGLGIPPTGELKAPFETFAAAAPDGLTPPPDSPECIAFKKWNTAADGSGTSYYSGDLVGMPADDLTLYAIWAPRHTLTYDANGGSNPPESKAYFVGDLFRIASKTGMTAPEGKQFVKWNTAADGSGTSYNYGDLVGMPADDLTLFAIWEPFQDGSEAAPYLVNDFQDLSRVMFERSKHYIQTADITLPDPEEFDRDSNWDPTKPFTGSFNGGNFAISKLKINSNEYEYMGLFGYVAIDAVLKNINLVDVEVISTCESETACVGALAGYNAGTIQNCTVSGTVSGRAGSSIGGLVGKNEGTVENCTNNASIVETIKPQTETIFFNAYEGKFYLGDPSGGVITNPNGWSYDSESKVLTLDNFAWITSAPDALAIVGADQLTIHLAEGSQNTVTSVCDGSEYSAAIYVEQGNLTIKGTGALNVQGGPANYQSNGICLDSGYITISGGTVVATAGDAYMSSAITAENISISGGTVTAKAGQATGEEGMSLGFAAYIDLTISGGTVTATGNTNALSTENGANISVTAHQYKYWTNTEASAAGATGPINGSTIPFDNTVNPPYKYVKIAPATGQSSKGGGSQTPPLHSGMSFIIPPSFLSDTGQGGEMTFNSNLGNLTVSPDMLSNLSGVEGKKATIIISQGYKNNLSDDMKAAIDDRPLISINLFIDGKPTRWSNPDAPVTVSIPYTPTAEELLNPESIVIWYIDGSGNVVTVPNGRYDAASKTVTFSTTHFSDYAVVYNPVSFRDVDRGAWYYKAVNYLAAREITNGTDDDNFSPDAKLTRGEFIAMLMRAYGIEADGNITDNFADAGDTYYTGYLAAAKRLGLTDGVGNNLYAPKREITRQEMFTLLYNILKSTKQFPQADSTKAIPDFSDAGKIEPWAKEAVSLFVKTEIVEGNTGKLDPTATATRAELAQLLYKLECLKR